MIGENIKNSRLEKGMTQKELADKLFVTSQAVSRWENGEVEPSVSTLIEMAKIFEMSLDELINGASESPTIQEETKEEKPEVQIIEKVIVQEAKPVLAVCEKCNMPIYDANDIRRFDEVKHIHHGRHHSSQTISRTYCARCDNERLEELRKAAEYREKLRKENYRKRRIHAYVWPGLILAICILIGFSYPAFFVIGPLAYFTIACMILDNNFIYDMWSAVAGWGFVKMPGIIFSFSFGGLIFLIIAKIILFIIGMLLAFAAICFATALAFALSVFVYPFALYKAYKYIE